MTDEQIIKALECCATDDGNDCFQCPYGNIVYKSGNGGCVNRCREEALDLINRQQTKIEALQTDNKQLQSDVINANQNWDHIKGLWEREKEKVESAKQKVICACKMLNTAKSEAIKEFAERLKSKLNDLEFQTKTQRKTVTVKFCDDNANWVMHECIPEEVDKLVKEMARSDDE